MIFQNYILLLSNIKISADNLLESIREIDAKFKINHVKEPKDG